MKKEKRKPMDLPTDTSGVIRIDPLGMYTGIPDDKLDKPQQDADDL